MNLFFTKICFLLLNSHYVLVGPEDQQPQVAPSNPETDHYILFILRKLLTQNDYYLFLLLLQVPHFAQEAPAETEIIYEDVHISCGEEWCNSDVHTMGPILPSPGDPLSPVGPCSPLAPGCP